MRDFATTRQTTGETLRIANVLRGGHAFADRIGKRPKNATVGVLTSEPEVPRTLRLVIPDYFVRNRARRQRRRDSAVLSQKERTNVRLQIPSIATAILIVTALTSAGQTKDVAGSKDPALFTRMPGFTIDEYREQQFDAYEFTVQKGNSTAKQHVEGHWMHWRYVFNPAAGTPPSRLQIARNFQNAAQRLGGKTLYDAGPGNDYNSTLLISRNGTDTWVELMPRGTAYYLLIVEVQAMQQDVVANADALKSGLTDTGHAEVPGIFFDTAKSDVKPESQPALQEVVKMLKGSPALKVWVVGHTDNVGTAEANVALSNARAAAVVKALVAAGIDARRLTPHGDGPFAPVAANKTEDGRARNRRVELVAQ